LKLPKMLNFGSITLSFCKKAGFRQFFTGTQGYYCTFPDLVELTLSSLNPSRLAVIYKSMKKTDKEDVLKLVHILEDFREERLPTVAVPSDEEMERRKLLSSYQREQGSRTRAINRLHALFVSQRITTIGRKDLARASARGLSVERLSGLEREETDHLLECLSLCDKRLDVRMKESAAGDEAIERLQTVPGVGPKVAFAFVAHVLASQFDNAQPGEQSETPGKAGGLNS